LVSCAEQQLDYHFQYGRMLGEKTEESLGLGCFVAVASAFSKKPFRSHVRRPAPILQLDVHVRSCLMPALVWCAVCRVMQVALLGQCSPDGQLLEMGVAPTRDLDAQLVDSSGLQGLIVNAKDVPKWEAALQGRRPIHLLGARDVFEVLKLALVGF
jgi:hypothetical protein